ncbi:MAG: radical SAM protein [Thermodesulfobacteriota bacterium]
MSAGFTYYIDVVSSCNLRCPSCPQGNMRHVENPSGFMDAELLNAIIKKAVAEGHIATVGLFNWTEPFLHPHLARLIEVVNSHGVPCGLSTNLNLPAPLHEIMKAEPVSIIVSVSGFTQSVYGRTHRGGRIDLVKSRMVELAKAREETGAKTEIILAYHRYLGNLDEECLMRSYAEELGFLFRPTWARLMPVEKIMAAARVDSHESGLTSEDNDLIQLLALPLNETLEITREQDTQSCTLRDSQMALNVRGDVALCCGFFESREHVIGHYLSDSFEVLQQRKIAHHICGDCIRLGIPGYCWDTPAIDKVGISNLTRYYAKTGVDFGAALTQSVPTTDVLHIASAWEELRSVLRNKYPWVAHVYRGLKRIWSPLTGQ